MATASVSPVEIDRLAPGTISRPSIAGAVDVRAAAVRRKRIAGARRSASKASRTAGSRRNASTASAPPARSATAASVTGSERSLQNGCSSRCDTCAKNVAAWRR